MQAIHLYRLYKDLIDYNGNVVFNHVIVESYHHAQKCALLICFLAFQYLPKMVVTVTLPCLLVFVTYFTDDPVASAAAEHDSAQNRAAGCHLPRGHRLRDVTKSHDHRSHTSAESRGARHRTVAESRDVSSSIAK